MGDYFVMVERGSRPLPELRSVEQGTARIRFPRTNIYLAFELIFTQEGFDRFMASHRMRRDVLRCGGRLTICTPQELLEKQSGNEAQEGVSKFLDYREFAQLLQLTEVELRVAHRLAWGAIINDYQEQKR